VISLGDGDSRDGVALVLTPVPSSSVSGKVVGPPNIVSELGLHLYPVGSESLGHGGEQATALTTRNGEFSFASVPAGSYVLRAGTSKGRLVGNLETAAALPPSPGRGGASMVLRTLGDKAYVSEAETGRDLYFGEQLITVGADDVRGLVLELQRGATIKGQLVRDDGGVLPAGLQVWAESATADPSAGIRNGTLDVVAGSGRGFQIEGLRPGEYVLRASAGNLRIKSISIAAGRDVTDEPIAVQAETAVLRVVLTEQLATVSGAIRDADGRPAAGAAVIVFPVDRSQWTRYGFSAVRIRTSLTFGPDGYRIRGLPEGEYYIVAVDSELEPAWRDASFLEAATRNAKRIVLKWGSDIRQDLVLRRSAW
jgi:hypothetical protein